MLLPDFEKLFHAAIQITSFPEVMTALAPITEGKSGAYGGVPDVVVRKDRIAICAGGDLYVMIGERKATELLIKTMLALDPSGKDARFHVFREAATQLWHAKRYLLTYEYQKANLAELAKSPELGHRAVANLDRIAIVNGESPQSEEWRALLNGGFQEMFNIVMSHGEHANELRRYSPVRGFITEEQRGQIYASIMGRPLPPSPDMSKLT
ncbi:hypothetical protein [Pseudomonas japonica]|uniref:hypothetical protein n=1 Tax=Pseudomonas japonica TaxID=256466 RepID=UPI0015E40096|nr:hypothetical protein [Pseudomonas japonica]MBA1245822.1 hypothetical protein [Pseudomonas japonica]